MRIKPLLILLAVLGIALVGAVFVLAPKTARRPGPAVAFEPTPHAPVRTGPLTLADVRRVYVKPTLSKTRPAGFVDVDDPPLRHALADDEIFSVVGSPDEADATFGIVEEKVLRDIERTYRTGPIARTWAKETTANVEATLRDAKTHAVLWTSKKTKTVTGVPYYGELSAELVNQLKADYQKARSSQP